MARKSKSRSKPRRSSSGPSDQRLFGPLAPFKDVIAQRLLTPALTSLTPTGTLSDLRKQFNSKFGASISTAVLKGWMAACGIQLRRVDTFDTTHPLAPASASEPTPVAPSIPTPPPSRDDKVFDQEEHGVAAPGTQVHPGQFVAHGIGVVGGLLPN